MRNTYIENNDFETTLCGYLARFDRLGEEETDAAFATGRVTAKAIFAKVCDPTYNASAMDGIAVYSGDTLSATEVRPLTLRKGQFAYVNTGNPVNPPFDSVIMIEDVIAEGDNATVTAPSRPYQHLRCVGETIVATEMVLPSRKTIRPMDIGAILASGNDRISVVKRPVVSVIPTGEEMVERAEDLQKGKLMESNSRVFCALAEEYGGKAIRKEIVRDDREVLKQSILSAIKESDVVLVNAGSSAGTKDFTKSVIEELGEVYAHGLAIKPGKPTILGIINGKAVVGVPGYPVSAYVVMEKVVKPLVEKLLGLRQSRRPSVQATLTKRVVSSLKNAEYVRVALGYVDGKYFATPLERGASAVMSIVKADGIFTVPRHSEGVEAGEIVTVELYASEQAIKENLVVVGSHDVAVDVIGDVISISSAHVGSMGGILALKTGSAHVAPIHLLDENGDYNVSYVKKYFPAGSMALIRGLGRTQGLMVQKGNPKRILSVKDLEKGYTFANRQNGAGTRLLFDHLLQRERIEPSMVKGYEKEYTTHLGVATAVLSGTADCGMGVLSAARTMDLDFIPVGQENYDFLVPVKLLDDPRVKAFIEVVKSEAFAEKMTAMGGYALDGVGEVEIIE